MITVNAQVPENVYRQIQLLAKKEQVPVDQLVSIALSAQISAWLADDYIAQRAKRADWGKFQAILAKVPDVDPPEFDRLD